MEISETNLTKVIAKIDEQMEASGIPEDAKEDVRQECLVKISEKLKNFPELAKRPGVLFNRCKSAIEALCKRYAHKLREQSEWESGDPRGTVVNGLLQADKKFLTEEFDKVLGTLRPREEEVLRAIYYDGKSRVQIGKEKNVTNERVMQIEQKALRKMRHPTRLNPLMDFVIDNGEH